MYSSWSVSLLVFDGLQNEVDASDVSTSVSDVVRDAYTDAVMDGSEISERSSSTGSCFYGSDGVSFLYRSLVVFANIHF